MLSTGQTTVGTVAVQLDGTSNSNWQIHISNDDNTDTVYIGNGDVTSSTGLRLYKLEKLVLNMNPGETLHVISTKSGHSISWMKQV
jgi:hypothetical protein